MRPTSRLRSRAPRPTAPRSRCPSPRLVEPVADEIFVTGVLGEARRRLAAGLAVVRRVERAAAGDLPRPRLAGKLSFAERGLAPPHVPRQLLMMERGVVVRGRLRGRRIELDEDVDELDGEVEVFVRSVAPAHRTVSALLALIATLPPGARTKDDIDAELAAERGGWDRG